MFSLILDSSKLNGREKLSLGKPNRLSLSFLTTIFYSQHSQEWNYSFLKGSHHYSLFCSVGRVGWMYVKDGAACSKWNNLNIRIPTLSGNTRKIGSKYAEAEHVAEKGEGGEEGLNYRNFENTALHQVLLCLITGGEETGPSWAMHTQQVCNAILFEGETVDC